MNNVQKNLKRKNYQWIRISRTNNF